MAKTEDVRSFNKNLVIEDFKKYGIRTKNQIAKNTQLSLGTCTNMLKILLEEGTISRIEDAPSKKGRKNKQYVLNNTQTTYLCIENNQATLYDIKGDKLKVAMLDGSEQLNDFVSQNPSIKAAVTFHSSLIPTVPYKTITEAKACLYTYLNSQKQKDKTVACIVVRADKSLDLAIAINDAVIFGKNNQAGNLNILKLDDKVKANVNKLVANLVAYLNLDDIVIYTKKEIELKKVNKHKEVLPQIIFKDNIEQAVAEGLVLALKQVA